MVELCTLGVPCATNDDFLPLVRRTDTIGFQFDFIGRPTCIIDILQIGKVVVKVGYSCVSS